MKNTRSVYWRARLEKCRTALAAREFEVMLADTAAQARDIILGQVFPQTGAKTVSWGDSETLHATGILDALKRCPNVNVIETFDARVERADLIERRRQALRVDFFITGTNAITESGRLVNLDMVGNRVGAIAFGPRSVVILAGRNKIVPDLASAMARIRRVAAPINAVRHRIPTPCVKSAECRDCRSPSRICNTWTITERSCPRGRIKVVLIDADLGF